MASKDALHIYEKVMLLTMNESQCAAFRATCYRFESQDGELLLKVDEPNAVLAELLRNSGADCAAVITAFNPHGRRQDDVRNHAAQARLLRDLASAGHALVSGRNEDPTGQWPVEDSLLVPGIDQADARALAAQYGQLAFLWMDAATATPRLIGTAAGNG